MCLSELKDFRVRKMEGYKVFSVSPTGILRSIVEGNFSPIPKRKWVNADNWMVGADPMVRPGCHGAYKVGWHICTNKKGTLLWKGKTFHVKFRGILAKGTQCGNVVVAQEMMILGEV